MSRSQRATVAECCGAWQHSSDALCWHDKVVRAVLQELDWSSTLLQPSGRTALQGNGRNTAALFASFSWTASAWLRQIHETCKIWQAPSIETITCIYLQKNKIATNGEKRYSLQILLKSWWWCYSLPCRPYLTLPSAWMSHVHGIQCSHHQVGPLCFPDKPEAREIS